MSTNLCKLLKLLGFIIAAFLWSFYLVQSWLAHTNYMNGVNECVKYYTTPTGVLPKGDVQAENIASLTEAVRERTPT
jgi:hypothetical protein